MAAENEPRFFRDENGYPHAEFPGRLEPLGIFLEQDIQSSGSYCRELLSLIEDVQSGRILQHESSGNAYLLTATHGDFFLQNLYDEEEPVVRVRPAELRQALLDWLAIIDPADEGLTAP